MQARGTESISPQVLSAKLIPAPQRYLLDRFNIGNAPTSFGLISCNFDVPLFIALDEATKASPITVLETKSFYAGGPASTGEAYGIMSGSDDDVVREGMKACIETLQHGIHLYRTLKQGHIVFPHVISSLGDSLSTLASIPPGDALSYLMGPPLESVFALDNALKVAGVRVTKDFLPNTPTNRGGALVTGPLHECEAAAEAFLNAFVDLDNTPVDQMHTYTYETRR
jgi:ethanolamine utilization protein EutL